MRTGDKGGAEKPCQSIDYSRRNSSASVRSVFTWCVFVDRVVALLEASLGDESVYVRNTGHRTDEYETRAGWRR
jgi:hypothetical protein